MKRILICLGFLLTLLPVFTACQQKALVDEKMQLIEGTYLNTQLGVPAEDPAYYGQVVKQDGKWVFKFALKFQRGSDWTTFPFTQAVTWNPVVGAYAFESLTESECSFFVGSADPSQVMTHYEAGKIVVVAYSGSYGFGNTAKAAKYVWTKVSGVE